MVVVMIDDSDDNINNDTNDKSKNCNVSFLSKPVQLTYE